MVHRCLTVIAIVAALVGLAAPAHAKPNIVLILIDDMGWADLSCFGNRAASTPNIDRLAAEGLRFEQFYVAAPICSPSRTAITTGQYPQRWRIGSYLADRRLNDARGVAQWLDPQAPTLPRILHDAGYATGHFGKWHMGGQRDVGEAPLINAYGFDRSLTNFEGLGPRLLPLCDAYDGQPPKPHALGSDKLGHGPISWVNRTKVTAGYVAAALDFIKDCQSRDQPFYLNLWPDDVHSPFFPPAERRGDGSKRSLYHGVLETMDEQLTPLLAHLRDDASLRDNTVVLLMSDNGPEPGAGSARPFRGHKGQLYEGGIRSPLIVWAPQLVSEQRRGAVVQNSWLAAIDLAPSLLAIAEVATPAGVEFDGQSLKGLLLGKSDASRDAPLFFRRPPDRGARANGAPLPDLAVRDGDWKLLCAYDGSRQELYDLGADRRERVNVAGDHPEVVAKLTAMVTVWHASLPSDRGAEFKEPPPR
jgi:arylsulfatase A-like enzyme